MEIELLRKHGIVSFSMEINGSISMGGGVLEAPTTKLRTYPVPDIREWTKAQRNQLVQLAEVVWKSSKPLDWTSNEKPDKELLALDEFVLQCHATSVSSAELHRELFEAVASRYRLAKDKTGKQKKHRSESVASVAAAVSDKLRSFLESKLFPEGFSGGSVATEHFDMLGNEWSIIELHSMMGQTEVWIYSVDGEKIQYTFPSVIAEIVALAIMLGRSSFDFPIDTKIAASVLDEIRMWLNTLHKMLEEAITATAAGSGYEDAVRVDVLAELGVHPSAFENIIPKRIER